MFSQSLFDRNEKLELTDEGSIDKCLGVEIRKLPDGSCELNQPCLIQRTTKGLIMSHFETQKKPTPTAKSLLRKNLKGKTSFDQPLAC